MRCKLMHGMATDTVFVRWVDFWCALVAPFLRFLVAMVWEQSTRLLEVIHATDRRFSCSNSFVLLFLRLVKKKDQCVARIETLSSRSMDTNSCYNIERVV
mmetsp:Transcript_115319/g.235747  ORF Transcript_115319/g.235747 Transcript_115319/m.235747 type:complete len:100 (+) Transcript_115319:3157-3456(+)